MGKIYNLNSASTGKRGFSFIELVVSTALVGILAVMALNSFNIYKDITYREHSAMYLKDAQTSLEAGRVEYNTSNSNFLEAVINNVGNGAPITLGTTESALLPGMTVDPDVNLIVVSYPVCFLGRNGTGCILDYVYINHCKTTERRWLWRLNNEITIESVMSTPQTC